MPCYLKFFAKCCHVKGSPKAGVPKLMCALEPLGEHHPCPRDFIGLGCGLDFGMFKRSPGDSNVQTSLGATDLCHLRQMS